MMMRMYMGCVCRAYLLVKKQLDEKRAQARSLRDQRDVSYTITYFISTSGVTLSISHCSSNSSSRSTARMKGVCCAKDSVRFVFIFCNIL